MNRRILVVDDEQPIRDLLSQAFSSMGYQVDVAADGDEALDQVAVNGAQLVFLDLKLPGLNGLELGKRIRKFNPLAVVYAMTGYPSLFELADCREAGFDDYFRKPVKLQVLFKAASDAFERLERWRDF
ncbi:response regulator [Desulfocarbo indianensis]|nr:response regulator [Desulfocarbo indianensis]